MKFKRNLLILSVILIGILIVVAGCTTPITTAVTGVTLNQTTMALPTGGATGTLVATVAPATATNTSVTWSSSTPTVATVANGVVTSVAAGTTTITVTTVDGSFTATCAVTVTSVVVISTAAIAGVTKPVTGATPVVTITAATQYTGTVTWSPTATTFAASKAYTATITLTPTTGYTLTGVAANLFTVSGATTATNSADSGIVTAVFPATAAVTTITTAAIAGVTAPITGATPVTTITVATQYTGTVTWSSTPTTFAASTAYTATITLTPTTGYTLTGVAANFFTVTGATATNTVNLGVVTAVFAATAAPVIATASTIANAASAPTVTVTGTGFKTTIAAADLTVGVGTTGLTLGTVTYVSATQITVAFTGTAAAGNVTIQAKTSAFTPTAGAASNTLIVTVPAASSTSPDATKLFVSAQNDNAKYTSLPSGYSVKVYSGTTDVAASATLKGEISVEDSWTGLDTNTGDTDYIFFELIKTGWTSDRTSDGQIPAVPNAAALGSIQATGASTVTSSAAGNLTTGDSIKCYVVTTDYSTTGAVNVGTTMTLTTALVAANAPKYTKTNTAGHESILSAADGAILILTGAVGNNGTGTVGTLDTGDTITLSFTNGASVIVKHPILGSHITWTPTNGSSVFGATADQLRDTADSATSVVLVATSSVVDIDSDETVSFNVASTIPIVDAIGGNYVLPKATIFSAQYDSGDF